VITSGSYSDYNITCVYLNKKDAEDFVNKMNGDFSIEEFEEAVPISQWLRFSISMDLYTGAVLSSKEEFPEEPHKSDYGLLSVGNFYLTPAIEHTDPDNKIFISVAITVLGLDKDHALKRAVDIRNSILALGLERVIKSANTDLVKDQWRHLVGRGWTLV